MQVRSYSRADLPAVHRLLMANGWSHRIGDAGELGRLIDASQRAVVALQGDALVGFARAITDGLSNGYLSMVVVDAPVQRQGIGRALVDAIVGADPHITWVLRAGRNGAPAFFAKLGFAASALAMERPRGNRTGGPDSLEKDADLFVGPLFHPSTDAPTGPAITLRPALRPALATDAHALAALSIQVWLSTYATDGVNDRLARHVLEAFTPPKFAALAEAPDTALLVAQAGMHLVGYALVRFGAAQALTPACDTELCTLYVQEAFTGTGVGTLLLRGAHAAAGERTGSDALWLSVNVRNRRACRFYEKQGFAIQGRTWFVLGEDRHENHVLGRP